MPLHYIYDVISHRLWQLVFSDSHGGIMRWKAVFYQRRLPGSRSFPYSGVCAVNTRPVGVWG